MSNVWSPFLNFITRRERSMMITLSAISISVFTMNSCMQDGLSPEHNSTQFSPRLSDYRIFQGDPSRLIPSREFKLYELSTELFTDYAIKQRLIKIPAGKKMNVLDDKLPEFPDSTVLVKTFYYYHDERDTVKGKRIIETRILIKSNSGWNVAAYLWNDEQTDAALLTTGLGRTVNWINSDGEGKVIAYHIPSNRECATCHNADNSLIPIGPKLRNLNRDVVRNSETINQLSYLMNVGLMDSVNLSGINTLPDWKDASFNLEERARAYLDVNCSHCHSRNGYASDSKLVLDYELSYHDARIGKHKDEIMESMKRGRMPFIGTTIVHEEGLQLIESYIKSLN